MSAGAPPGRSADGPSRGARPPGGDERSEFRGDVTPDGPSRGARPPGGDERSEFRGDDTPDGPSRGARPPGGDERSEFRGHPIRAVVFDLDGTLSDNYDGISRSILHALERMGAPAPDAATLRKCVGPPLRESFARLVPGDDPARVERAVLHYRERFRDVGWRENAAYDGMGDLLGALARERALYVCTSKPETFAVRIVEHFGFHAHVLRTYGADLAGAFDDKRALLGHLLERERLDPATTTMVGDRHHDVRAAKAHGVAAIGVLWGYGDADELAGADALAATPAEFARLLARSAG